MPDPAVFPDWHAFIGGLKAQYNVRVLLWMTSMIDHDSPNFAEALASKYFVQDALGRQGTNLSWWHGTGGLVDYSNPAARAWWEAQMAPVLRGNGSAGTNVDGWKCDGTDPYIIELLEPRGFSGALSFAQYSDYYYGHSLNFSRSIVPDALIWSRPVDSFPLALNISAFLEYSPKYVVFSGWVGDQDPTFAGMKDALINMFESAWRNYTNFGSDSGGYRTGNRTRELFCRWVQLNAFLPLFENGGNGDHTPWGFDAAQGGGGTEVRPRGERDDFGWWGQGRAALDEIHPPCAAEHDGLSLGS
jgi:alpha-glucosidase (family GH31 glycosyl hydrolase)